MKVFFSILSLFSGLLFLSYKGFASDIKGAELSYNFVAPATAVVEYTVYYDCQTQNIPATKNLNLTGSGCAFTQTIILNNHGVSSTLGNPYCKVVGNACGTVSLPNYVVVKYSATINIGSTIPSCSQLTLSVRECPGIQGANLAVSPSSCSVVEAYIDPAIYNIRSPQFTDYRLPFVTVNSPAAIPFLVPADDWQSDSMVYSLIPIKDSLNMPLSYTGNYSFSNPVPSGSGVQLHPKTGQLTFTPNLYVSGAQPEANEYAVLVEIAEYRKINGIVTKVGSSQRLTTIHIVNNAPNQNPEIINATINGQSVLPNSITQVLRGSTLTFQFGTDDANPADTVTIVQPSGTSFTNTGSARPNGTLIWQGVDSPNDQIVYFPVMIRDNACPVRGITTQVYGIKVIANPTGMLKEQKFDLGFTAFPNPFTDEVNFKCSASAKAESIIIYNLLGQQVDEIQVSKSIAGGQNVQWQNAARHAAGTYVAKLVSADKSIQVLKFVKLQ